MGGFSGFPTRVFPKPGNLQAMLHEIHRLLPGFRSLSARGNTWFVDGNNGSNGNNDGKSWETAFATMSALDDLLGNGDVVYLSGVLREQWTAPIDVFDVTIIGAANRPRQATDGGVATGGGATWLAPTSPVAETPLLTLREQAWTIINIFFAAETDAACIKLHRTELSAAMDASHASIIGCRFGAGSMGIEDFGGNYGILVDSCTFHNLTHAIRATNYSIALSNAWVVRNCRILPCTNGLVGAWVDSVFEYNHIQKSTTITIHAATGGTGLRNHFYLNHFNIAAAAFDPDGGVTGNATDAWHSVLTDAVETGVPTN